MSDTGMVVSSAAMLHKPKEVLKQVQEVSNLLMDFVEKKNLSKKFGNAEAAHIMLPAWQFAGHFFGITAKVTRTEPYQDEIGGAYGFKAYADAIQHGQVVSSAEALCLNDEDNWGNRPVYEWKNIPGVGRERMQTGTRAVPSFQLMSMAQTRAMSKVLSNVLRFVVVLAGYDGTPAEDMSEQEPGREPERKSEQQAAKSAPQQQSSVPQQHNNAAGPITEGQVKRLFAIRKETGCTQAKCGEIVLAYGFPVIAAITRDKYDAIVSDIQNWQTWTPGKKAGPPEELPQ